MFARMLVVAVVIAAALGWTAPASAHGVSATADVQLAQTIGGVELTVVIRRTPQVAGPLYVDLIAHGPVPELSVDLAVGAGGGPRKSTDTVELEAGRPGTYASTLQVKRTGPHLLELRAGGEKSVLPFRVLTPKAATWELLTNGGFGFAAVLILATLFAGATARRRTAVALGGGASLALVVALTVAMLSSQLPRGVPDGAVEAPPTDPAAAAAQGRPYVQAAAATTPAAPNAGEEFTLRFDLTDGSTGRRVDDLVPHHAALAHMVVTSKDGGFFRHVHPRRLSAGRLAVTLTVDRPGRYLAWAELERDDSGGQLMSAKFDVDGDARPAEPPTGASDGRVTLSPGRAVAGRPTTIDLDAGSDDLQPWLGMAGHLIARDESGGFLGHVHEQDSMSTQDTAVAVPDETVAEYGPRLRFTFSFPEPGRYFVWVQYARDFRIHTVPFTVNVIEEEK